MDHFRMARKQAEDREKINRKFRRSRSSPISTARRLERMRARPAPTPA
jgi:hypothetical protein